MTAQEKFEEAHREWEEGVNSTFEDIVSSYEEGLQEYEDAWDFSEMISEHAEDYLDENNRLDDRLYDFDDYFFNEFFNGNPEEAARAVYFGDIKNWNDPYVRFNAYGNLESVYDKDSYYEGIIDEDEFQDWCKDKGYYDLSDYTVWSDRPTMEDAIDEYGELEPELSDFDDDDDDDEFEAPEEADV